MKTCFKCKETKDISEFYKHSEMKDGYLNKCKSCTKIDVSINYRKNISHYVEYDKKRSCLPHRIEARNKYALSDNGKEAHKRVFILSNNKFPEKRSARVAVGNAIRDGFLIKKPCFSCGSSINVQAHHEDYNKPLDVVWLCVKCHRAEHGQ